MKKTKLLQWLIVFSLMMFALPGVAVSAPPDPREKIVVTLHNSHVGGSPSVGGDPCFKSGAIQTFCFTANSYTTDDEDVYYLWMRFPEDWEIYMASLQGTPYCTNGGTFDVFGWGGGGGWNEAQIFHYRYQNNNDSCFANYCFQVKSGTVTSGFMANVSWYWSGSENGSPPYRPCSDDKYTPSGWLACDDWDRAPAYVPSCPTYLPLLLTGE